MRRALKVVYGNEMVKAVKVKTVRFPLLIEYKQMRVVVDGKREKTRVKG